MVLFVTGTVHEMAVWFLVDLVRQIRKYQINPIIIMGQFNCLIKLLKGEWIRTITAGHVPAIEPNFFKYWMLNCNFFF